MPGTIPVVIGAPNIYNFAPSNNSILYIKTVDDIAHVAKKMLYLSTHDDAYNATLR
jgi:glycoprotein 3-alpha-L-fucosyltransferase